VRASEGRNGPSCRVLKARRACVFLSFQARKFEDEKEMQRLMANPMDPEAQRKMAELIQQSNIKENYEMAMEEMPESFGKVVMLYVDASVNNVQVLRRSTSACSVEGGFVLLSVVFICKLFFLFTVCLSAPASWYGTKMHSSSLFECVEALRLAFGCFLWRVYERKGTLPPSFLLLFLFHAMQGEGFRRQWGTVYHHVCSVCGALWHFAAGGPAVCGHSCWSGKLSHRWAGSHGSPSGGTSLFKLHFHSGGQPQHGFLVWTGYAEASPVLYRP
jgi:hypothetical protein